MNTDLEFTNCPSPNFDHRPRGKCIDSVVIHYTAKSCVEDAIEVFQDPQTKLSAHYTICRDGVVFSHVDPKHRAWHAGQSRFGCRKRFNDFSIGIELYNPGHNRGYVPYTDRQIGRLVHLMRHLYARYPIKPSLVLGHSDISPERKKDPGHLFPWDRLTREGMAQRPQFA